MNSHERLEDLVARMALKNNYWGYLFSRVRRSPMEDLPSIMGVAPEKDATITLLYNPKMIESTLDVDLMKVIEHEGLHLLNKHIPRCMRILSDETNILRKKMKSDVWNIAADCCVNSQARFPETLKIAGQQVQLCLPKLYNLPDNKASEFYFNKLLKSGKGTSMTLFDDHSSWSKNIEGVPDLSSLSRKIENYVGNIVIETVKNFNKSRGTLPGYISELIEQVLESPKAPYYQIIRKLVRGTRLSKFKRAFSKVNRKRTYVFTIGDKNLPAISPFPGRTRDLSFDIGIILDTSGSMLKDDILEGLSGVKNIIENDRHCKVTVLENDTQVQKEYQIKRLRDIQFNIRGRGGTTLRPALERCKELKFDVTLCFTDGYCDNINMIPRKLLPKKIIWVVGKNGSVDNINKTGFIVRT